MPVSFLVECDDCRGAYIRASTAGDVTEVLAYIGTKRWSVVVAADTVRVLCPRCSRIRRKEIA